MMDCNRDEATRAKEIAETKFSAKDIMGAKKFALKAQSLYPALDGISQLLAILDVYVAAENKINGELDYYGILGVGPLADDDTIRKHYRKLALSLHPDKNKSIGADGAFKFVSEAWNLLSDKDKRITYDHKRNVNVRVFKQRVRTQNGGSGAPTPSGKNGFRSFTKCTSTRTKGTSTTAQAEGTSTTAQAKGTSTTAQAKGTSNAPRDNTNATNKKGPTAVPSLSNKQTGPTSVSSASNKQITPKTFWTLCKRCKLQYEFVRMYLNRNLLCPTCHGPFLAIETPPPNTKSSSEVPEKVQGASENGSNPTSNDTSSKWGPFLKTASPAADVSQAASMIQQAYEKVKRDREEAQTATKRKEALRRKISNKHSNSVKRKPDLDGFVANKETRTVGSSISSGQVDIKKDISDGGIKNQLIKKATMEIKKKLHEWSSETAIDSTVGEKGKVNGLVNGDLNNHRSESVMTHVPDPDFHDFDRERSEKCFEEGQVWAAYDDHDGMPRFYAMIQKVISIDPFKIKVCWLNSTSNNHTKPSSGFLKAFGEFKVGKHEIVSVPNYFSHKASFTKLANGNIRVFPRKHDVCALYRNDQKHKYEIVEVDEYDEETGITVTPLIKVAGFKTVFHRHINPKETRVVLGKEINRFSHKIPAYLLTGQESPDAPKGCRELDPAATPAEFLQVKENANEDDDDEMLEEDCVSK